LFSLNLSAFDIKYDKTYFEFSGGFGEVAMGTWNKNEDIADLQASNGSLKVQSAHISDTWEAGIKIKNIFVTSLGNILTE
jgi:hypothetical protein